MLNLLKNILQIKKIVVLLPLNFFAYFGEVYKKYVEYHIIEIAFRYFLAFKVPLYLAVWLSTSRMG